MPMTEGKTLRRELPQLPPSTLESDAPASYTDACKHEHRYCGNGEKQGYTSIRNALDAFSDFLNLSYIWPLLELYDESDGTVLGSNNLPFSDYEEPWDMKTALSNLRSRLVVRATPIPYVVVLGRDNESIWGNVVKGKGTIEHTIESALDSIKEDEGKEDPDFKIWTRPGDACTLAFFLFYSEGAEFFLKPIGEEEALQVSDRNHQMVPDWAEIEIIN